MNYKKLTSEAEVPFSSTDVIKRGLKAKYGDDLEAFTFGIELEYSPVDSDGFNRISYDWDEIRDAMRSFESVKDEYYKHVENKRDELNKKWNGRIDDWDDSYGPVDGDRFERYNPPPDSAFFTTDEKYHDAYDSWKDQLDDVIKKHQNWISYDYNDKLDDFIKTLDPSDYLDIDAYSISYVDDIVKEIESAMNYIESSMKQDVKKGAGNKRFWGVGEDAEGIVEIRSKHLSQNEFHLVELICEYVEQHETKGNTSAHVHIGLPKDFDAFDLLALTTLVDEKAIKDTTGPGRSFDAWAQLRNSLHTVLYGIIMKKRGEIINKSFFINDSDLKFSFRELGRFYGTNISSMLKHGTIEFRYLDSRIASRSDVFINWIRYFLLLPKIAQSRNKITLKRDADSLVAVREPNGVRFYVNTSGPAVGLPAATIKTNKLNKF